MFIVFSSKQGEARNQNFEKNICTELRRETSVKRNTNKSNVNNG